MTLIRSIYNAAVLPARSCRQFVSARRFTALDEAAYTYIRPLNLARGGTKLNYPSKNVENPQTSRLAFEKAVTVVSNTTAICLFLAYIVLRTSCIGGMCS